MAITQRKFGNLPDGREVTLYSIVNANGMQADVMDFGVNIVNLFVPVEGGKRDINLGYDSIEPYLANTDNFGATIGPNCNRIGGASFLLDGKRIQLPVNDGENNLHTDLVNGLNKQIWQAQPEGDHVVFSIQLKDGDGPLPGNRQIQVTVTLNDEDELILHYEASSDQNTIFNFTNHAYFNLDGHDAGSIEDHTLWLRAKKYTPLRKGGIPDGSIVDVAGTVMDFTSPRRIGDTANSGSDQTLLVGGIDHNFVIDDYDGFIKLVAELHSEKSAMTMSVYTDLPGIQIYSGNFVGEQKAKDGATYNKRCGIALESQYFPDAPNHDNFASTVFGPGRDYESTTIYKITR